MRILFAIFVLGLISCNPNQKVVDEKLDLNDTAEVLKVVFDSAINNRFLSDYSLLPENNLYSDSVYLLYDSIYSKFIYSFDNLKFKIVTKSQICDLATKVQTANQLQFPNYLIIKNFRLIDSTYNVSIRNYSVIPLLNDDGSLKYSRGILGEVITQKFADSAKCSGTTSGGCHILVNKVGEKFEARLLARTGG